MPTSPEEQLQQEIEFPGLPLAVYREIAAHLSQVEGVQTGLYEPNSLQFDYNQSQVGGLWIRYTPTTWQQVEQILAYYQERYGC